MRDEAERRIGHLYPKARITPELVAERPDLKRYEGRELTVIAWLWARTVRSPNPAFAHVEVPLVSTFLLSKKKKKEAYVEPVVEHDRSRYRFEVQVGTPPDPAATKAGTKLARGAHFRCLVSDAPMTGGHIKAEGRAGRMSARLLAVVAEGDRERVYLSPTEEMEEAARQAKPTWRPDSELPNDHRNFWTVEYGLKTFGDLFTPRQLVALTTFSDLVGEATARVQRDAITAGLPDDNQPLRNGGTGATAYAEAVAVYLSLGVNRLADVCNSLCRWELTRRQVRNLFSRQAIPMMWDYAENNVFSNKLGDYRISLDSLLKGLSGLPDAPTPGHSSQEAAQAAVPRAPAIFPRIHRTTTMSPTPIFLTSSMSGCAGRFGRCFRSSSQRLRLRRPRSSSRRPTVTAEGRKPNSSS